MKVTHMLSLSLEVEEQHLLVGQASVLLKHLSRISVHTVCTVCT